MDTESLFFLEGLKTKHIDLPTLAQDEYECITSFVEVSRHVHEIEQLFHNYRFNFHSIFHYYKLFYNGACERITEFGFEIADRAAINALTISLISSGKTLVDSISSYMQSIFGKDSDICCRFEKDVLRNYYDRYFPYRFLIRLRDFSQHGHSPVSLDPDGSRWCFDLFQIINTPHFSHNRAMEAELNGIMEEITAKMYVTPRIAYVPTLARYNLCINKIYVKFFKTIKGRTLKLQKDMQRITDSRPDIIRQEDDLLKGFLFFEADGMVHTFDPSADFVDTFLKYIDFADKNLIQEQAETHKILYSIRKRPI